MWGDTLDQPPDPLQNAINMTRCDISLFLLSNMTYLMHLKSVTVKFEVKSLIDLNLGLVRNVSRIKSSFIHDNMKSMKTWDYRALLRSNMFPEMYLNRPKGKHDQLPDSCCDSGFLLFCVPCSLCSVPVFRSFLVVSFLIPNPQHTVSLYTFISRINVYGRWEVCLFGNIRR